MNHGPLLFLGLFLSITISWVGTLVVPHLQFGAQEMVIMEDTGLGYPAARPGEAAQGAEVYRANGCHYCHTQQVRSTAEGSDLARGWGKRRTVARDYLRDQPVMLGQMRYGPDLANLGMRETNAHRLLLRLYNSRIAMPGSTMPRYPYLFEERPIRPGSGPSPDALPLPDQYAARLGYEVVPRAEARSLAAYLMSLKSDALFYEVFPPAPPKKATNAVDGVTGTNTTDSASATNSPAAAASTEAPPAP